MTSNTDKKAQMRAMREQGAKHREIAEVFGVSVQYVSMVCGSCAPARFVPLGDECIYPNFRKWMNENKVSRSEFVRRMGLTAHDNNLRRLYQIVRGELQPNKPYIDKMLEITGLTYEVLFAEVEDGN